MTLRSQSLINQFIDLKKKPINDAVSWQNSSEQVQKLSSLLHKFYLDEVRKLDGYKLINDLVEISLIKLVSGHQISLTQKLELQYNNLTSLIIIPLYTPTQLVAMLQDNLSENEQQLLELFIVQSDTWLAINLGLYLQSQPA